MKNKLRIISVVIASFLLALTFSCIKEAPLKIPTVITTALRNITSTSAVGGGDVTSYGGTPVTARGVCWSLSQSPTIQDNKTSDDAGIGSFTSSIIGLTPGITYYVRAYATNSIGTAYGSQITLTALAILPTLTTNAITNMSATSATSGGSITNDGGAAIISRGVCWSTIQTPTIANSKTIETSGLSTFTSSIIRLTPSTTYYVRAYATNSVGTAYGTQISFNTYGSVSDIDGNVYKTILIGTQTWMAENLKTTKYRNGNLIGTTTPTTLDVSYYVYYPAPAYQWAYAGDESKVATYGRLYSWYAVVGSTVCPTGWHVPNDSEWTTLITFLGGENVAGGKLKETGTSHWSTPNTGATNISGFTALPGGYRSSTGISYAIGADGNWWSSSDYYARTACYRIMTSSYNGVFGSNRGSDKPIGMSVRCIKN